MLMKRKIRLYFHYRNKYKNNDQIPTSLLVKGIVTRRSRVNFNKPPTGFLYCCGDYSLKKHYAPDT